MISNNITTSYIPTSLQPGANLKTSTANTALFQTMLQSQSLALRDSANPAFGIGSVGTKTIITSPFQVNTTLANIPVTDVNTPAAVSGENMQMSDYLDTYKRIYDKYAAIYGDGFEFTPCIIAHGNAASEAAGQKILQMKKDFERELYANIPSEFLSFSDPDFAVKAASSGLTLREYAILQGADEIKMNEMVVGGYVPDTIEKMFYLEKYGLEGLSTREQIDKIMAQFGKGTFGDFSKGLGILFSAGAITGDEHRRAISQAYGYARDEEFGKAMELYDSSDWEEFFRQYWENIIFHMQNAASAKYDWEDVFRNNMYGSFSYDGNDTLTTKLFG